jgi:hypothetical protein
MRVRVSAQMGVMTETPDSPLLRKPHCAEDVHGFIDVCVAVEPRLAVSGEIAVHDFNDGYRVVAVLWINTRFDSKDA